MSERVPVLYLAPWVGYGGSDKSTIDWFRWIDRERFAPTLIATQPSPNPLLDQVEPYADEVWVLPDLMPAEQMPAFIFDFLQSRQIRVVHLMNSRIGFDLLPDLSSLAAPPVVVVQMHAEETDRSGYVRYVTTRYGEHVDCFSLSNEHVAKAVREYGIPPEKTRVIYTGIDAEGEFSPELAKPAEQLPADRLQILFAARLVDQKDPLLMVEVAAALRDRGVDFEIHVVGEGDLEGKIEARVEALDLSDQVILHPPVAGLLNWYAACDVLLLTSTFEGVPVVIFEAMAMGLPIVTPGLPAIRELLDEGDEGVVVPRDSIAGYVEPLAHLAEDRAHLAARAAEMRARAKELFSVQQMAADHGELYEELIEAASLGNQAAGGRPVTAVAETGSTKLFLASTAADRLMADAELCEKVQRRFAAAGESLDAIALADAGSAGRFSLRALPREDSPADLVPHTVIWRREIEDALPLGLRADPAAPVLSLVRLLCGTGLQLEWRHLPEPGRQAPDRSSPPREWVAVAGGTVRPLPTRTPLPGAGEYRVPRWESTPTWVPPSSSLTVRHRARGDERRVVSSESRAPAGFEPEWVLGSLRSTGFQGTARLIEADGTYRTVAAERDDVVEAGATLGYVELAPLPGMDPLALAVHRGSGQHLLVCPVDDPLLAEVDLIEHLGFLDPAPLKPRETPAAQRPMGLLGLVKALDYPARRHRYAIGSIPAGEPAAELGALAESAVQGAIPTAIADGYLVTDRHRPSAVRPQIGATARWVGGPIAWRGMAGRGARAKVALRRGQIAAVRLLRPSSRSAEEAISDPAGWLFDRPRRGLEPLFAAYHPVTGDQLLVRHAESAAALGYGSPTLLGYLRQEATLLGDLSERPHPIPWARRFGHVPRPG